MIDWLIDFLDPPGGDRRELVVRRRHYAHLRLDHQQVKEYAHLRLDHQQVKEAVKMDR